ncbi:hypothetical protein P7K49_041046 [Saguinus oedipus]|uniref:Uncharacterized protein n=1 Tax=Saguinus oedipus TaxID=9490 RepID=A0ABQ9TAQ3_SAGOE|nr:hypothetical protein P7K49_041046 [Saguinus oedipus]
MLHCCCFHDLSALGGFLWYLFLLVESRPCRLLRNRSSLLKPLTSLPLAQTEPTREEQVQNTIMISFLKTVPSVLVQSPPTQGLAQAIPGCHEQSLVCSIRTRGHGLDSLPSNMNWDFCHPDLGSYLRRSHDWPPPQ